MADEPTPKLKVDAEELSPLYAGSAVYANRCFVTMGPVVRLAFMEQQGASGPLHFRTAVTLDLAQAVAFSNVLKGVLADVEEQIKNATAEIIEEQKRAEASGKNV